MVPELTPFEKLISFTRTSAASYVNSAGNVVTTPASKNLLTFTEEFDNVAWTKSNATVTANSVAAPDGLMTADTLVEDSVNGIHAVQQSATLSAVVHTLSVYLKAGTRSWAQILNGTIANGFAYFDLANGAVGNVGAGVSATSIVSAGDGWYRCSITFTASSGGNISAIRAASVNGSASYAGTTSAAAIHLWGAQLELGSTATSYVRNFGGLFPPRFDYDPVTLQPRGLLIEEQRTNLLLRSEEFDNASWVKAAATVTANAAVSPDGTMDADKLIATVANSQHRVDFATTSAAATHAFSVYAKPAGYNFLFIRLGMNGGYVNLSDGTIAGVTSGYTLTATPAGNGWYRVVLVGAAALNEAARINVTETVTSDFAGDGTSGIFIWGAQLEAGSFATSYIPTAGSQVTRTADQAGIVAPNFAPWYNQNEGTLVAEFSSLMPTAASQFAWTISNGTSDERWCLFMASSTLRHFMADGGTTQASIDAGTYAANTVFKSAMAIKANSVQAAINGVLGTEDTAATLPTVDRLFLGAAHSGATNFLSGHIRRISYYPSRLSNAQLQALSA